MKVNQGWKNQAEHPIQKRFEASVDGDDVKLYLHGTVGASWDGFDFEKVQNAMQGVAGQTIEVHLNSYGGDMFEGIAIKNYLMQRPEKVRIVIDGVAASAASVVAMAGDEILMPKDTQLMIHNPWTWAAGNAKELRKVADDLDKAESSIRQSYLDRFVGTVEELQTLLDEETYLTAEEAVALGLADRIYGEEVQEELEAEEVVVDSKESLLAKYGGFGFAAKAGKVHTEDVKTEDIPSVSMEGLKNFAQLFTSGK